jgi:hypothetical protein
MIHQDDQPTFDRYWSAIQVIHNSGVPLYRQPAVQADVQRATDLYDGVRKPNTPRASFDSVRNVFFRAAYGVLEVTAQVLSDRNTDLDRGVLVNRGVAVLVDLFRIDLPDHFTALLLVEGAYPEAV